VVARRREEKFGFSACVLGTMVYNGRTRADGRRRTRRETEMSEDRVKVYCYREHSVLRARVVVDEHRQEESDEVFLFVDEATEEDAIARCAAVIREAATSDNPAVRFFYRTCARNCIKYLS